MLLEGYYREDFKSFTNYWYSSLERARSLSLKKLMPVLLLLLEEFELLELMEGFGLSGLDLGH